MTPSTARPGALRGREFRRILLIKPSSLGDIVHALPVLHGLRRRYPDAHVAWLAARSFAPLIADHADLDEVIVFDRRRYGLIGRNLRASADFGAFVRDLRRRQFDLVVDLQGLFRSGFLAMVSGAAVRVGFAEARECAWMFYNYRVPPLSGDVHAADANYRVAALLGFDDVPVTFDLGLTEAERRRGAELLAREGIAENAKFAAVLPGARWDTKRWAPQRFSMLIDRLDGDLGLPTVLLGGPLERALCVGVAEAASADPVNLAERTTLRELVAILGRAGVVICHDSAPMHLAAALGRPMVCILGPTNPRRTGPYDRSAAVLQADLPCVPCYLRRLRDCPYDHECMKQVDVDGVVNAVRGELARLPAVSVHQKQ